MDAAAGLQFLVFWIFKLSGVFSHVFRVVVFCVICVYIYIYMYIYIYIYIFFFGFVFVTILSFDVLPLLGIGFNSCVQLTTTVVLARSCHRPLGVFGFGL